MSSSAVYMQADETPHLSFLLLLSEGSVLRPLSRAVWVVLSTAVLTAVTPVPRQDMALCEMPSLLPSSPPHPPLSRPWALLENLSKERKKSAIHCVLG